MTTKERRGPTKERPGPRVWRWRLRVLYWRVLGDRLAFLGLFLTLHGRIWADRWGQLRNARLDDSTEALLCGASAAIGAALCLVPAHPAMTDNLIAWRLDGYIPGAFGPPHLRMGAHHVFGTLLASAGMCGLAGVMEWPSTAERQGAAEPQTGAHGPARDILGVLLRMRLFGSMLAFAYWLFSGLLTFVTNPHSTVALLAFAAAALHHMAYRWANKQYGAQYGAAHGRRADPPRLAPAPHRAGGR